MEKEHVVPDVIGKYSMGVHELQLEKLYFFGFSQKIYLAGLQIKCLNPFWM